MSPSVVIVGSGPGAFYAAEGLAQSVPDWPVDMLDRLPTPFGLVRAGVAPDHQTTKGVTRIFDKIAGRDKMRFVGNVELGRDVSYDQLKSLYDVVVLAFGAERSRSLGIPGEDAAGVLNADLVIGWYNGHPDYREARPDLSGSSLVVVGNGNVALDVVRMMGASAEELDATDIAPYARDAIVAADFREIHLLGRRGPVQAAFSKAELAELGRMERCVPLVEEDQLPEALDLDDAREQRIKAANLKILRGYIGNDPAAKPVPLGIKFFAAPREVVTEDRDGTPRVVALRVEHTRLEQNRAVGTGEFFDLPADVVILCIGYSSVLPEGVPRDAEGRAIRHQDGRVEAGVYVTGWAKRGPSGTIATNRADSHAVVDLMVEDMAKAGKGAGGDKPGPAGLDAVLAERGVRTVSFADWETLNQAEVSRARAPAPRAKFTSIGEMLTFLDR